MKKITFEIKGDSKEMTCTIIGIDANGKSFTATLVVLLRSAAPYDHAAVIVTNERGAFWGTMGYNTKVKEENVEKCLDHVQGHIQFGLNMDHMNEIWDCTVSRPYSGKVSVGLDQLAYAHAVRTGNGADLDIDDDYFATARLYKNPAWANVFEMVAEVDETELTGVEAMDLSVELDEEAMNAMTDNPKKVVGPTIDALAVAMLMYEDNATGLEESARHLGGQSLDLFLFAKAGVLHGNRGFSHLETMALHHDNAPDFDEEIFRGLIGYWVLKGDEKEKAQAQEMWDAIKKVEESMDQVSKNLNSLVDQAKVGKGPDLGMMKELKRRHDARRIAKGLTVEPVKHAFTMTKKRNGTGFAFDWNDDKPAE